MKRRFEISPSFVAISPDSTEPTPEVDQRFQEIAEASEVVVDPDSGRRKVIVPLKYQLALSALLHLGAGFVANAYKSGDHSTNPSVTTEDGLRRLDDAQDKERERQERDVARNAAVEQLQQEASEYITATVERFFPEGVYEQSADLIVGEEVYFQIDAYQRALQEFSHLDTAPEPGVVQAEVVAFRDEMQQRYDDRLNMLLDANRGQWTGDPIVDYPRLQAAMFLGENRFFFNPNFTETQYYYGSRSTHTQLFSGYVNCTSARFVPTLLQDIYAAEGLETAALDTVGLVTWSDHVEAGVFDPTSSEYYTFYFGDRTRPTAVGMKKFGDGAEGVYLPPNEALRLYVAATDLVNDTPSQLADEWMTTWHQKHYEKIVGDGNEDTGALPITSGYPASAEGVKQLGFVHPITIFATDEPNAVDRNFTGPVLSGQTHEELPAAPVEFDESEGDEINKSDILDLVHYAIAGPQGDSGVLFVPEWTAWPEAHELLDILFSKEYIEAVNDSTRWMNDIEYVTRKIVLYTKVWSTAPFSQHKLKLRELLNTAKNNIYEMQNSKHQKEIIDRLFIDNYEIVQSDFSDLYAQIYGKQPIEAVNFDDIFFGTTIRTFLHTKTAAEIYAALEDLYPEVKNFPDTKAAWIKNIEEQQAQFSFLFNDPFDPKTAAGPLIKRNIDLRDEIYYDYLNNLTPEQISAVVRTAFPIIPPGERNEEAIAVANKVKESAEYFFRKISWRSEEVFLAFPERLSAEDWMQVLRSVRSSAHMAEYTFEFNTADFLPLIDAAAENMEPEKKAAFVQEVVDFYADPYFNAGEHFLNHSEYLRPDGPWQSPLFRMVINQVYAKLMEKAVVERLENQGDIKELRAMSIVGALTGTLNEVSIQDLTSGIVLGVWSMVADYNYDMPYVHKQELGEHLYSLYFQEKDPVVRLRLLERIHEYHLPLVPLHKLYPEDRITIEIGEGHDSKKLKSLYMPNAASVKYLRYVKGPQGERLLIQRLLEEVREDQRAE